MDKRNRRHIDKRMEQLRQERRKRNKRRGIIVLEMIIIIILSFATYGMFKYSKFNVDVIDKSQIVVNEGAVKEGYTTVALFGGDSRDGYLEAGSHTDTIMIVSINNSTKEVNVVSVYRDTISLQLDGDFAKINNAYFVGGPTAAINVLNINFDLDIMNYITVDFAALTNVVDLLGGVELDVSEEEMHAINNYVDETAKISGVTSSKLTTPGIQVLDGAQAVTYARIRKNVGEDFARTQRQRELIQVLLDKVNIIDLKTINELIDTIFSQVSTSFTVYEILELASAISQYEIIKTTAFPMEFTEEVIAGIGSTIVSKTHATNVEQLHEVLYPDESYIQSNMVGEINDYIVEILDIE